jgi:prevent-host-death family protein
MKMGLREANQNFSKAIKAIRAGKAIVLTERGKPIATITPIADETDEGDELQPLRDEGFLVGRQKSGVTRTRVKPCRITGLSVSSILRNERDED